MHFEEQFSIKLCEPSDAPTLAQLVLQLAVDEGHTPPPALDPLTELIVALLSSGFSDYLLAEREGAPVGCLQINYRLSTWDTAPYGALEDFYITPDVRGLGIGTGMLDYACQRADGRGCAYVEVAARPDSRAARRLYARMGFQPKPNEVWRRGLPTDAGCADSQEQES
jgi:GNAT superfamily N-acetyltransferase